MKNIMGLAVIVATCLFAAPSRADWQTVNTYHGQCSYRCCDTNNNCTVYSISLSDCGGCTWGQICTQGNPGWSAGPDPKSQTNSHLSCQSSCWQAQQDYGTQQSRTITCP